MNRVEEILMRSFDTPIITNDQSIDRVLAAGLPVTLLFTQGQVSLDLEQGMAHLAKEHAGHLLLAQIKMSDNPATVKRYQVNRAPGLVTIRNGEVVSKAENISGDDLRKHIAYLLGTGPRPAAPDIARPSVATSSTPSQPGSGRPLTVTDASFDREVLHSPQPVLIDFWAPWCGPCRMTDPIVQKLAGELAGRVRVAKVNVDENPGISMRYGIQSIPTMMVVRNGQIIDRWAGALPEPALRNRIAPLLRS